MNEFEFGVYAITSRTAHGKSAADAAGSEGKRVVASPLARTAPLANAHFRKGHSEPSPKPCDDCPVFNFGFCGGMLPEEAARIGVGATNGLYSDSTPIFTQGDNQEFVHIVAKGAVRLTRLLSDGRRTAQGFALPGEFLGPVGDRLHLCTAEAFGEVTACSLSNRAYLKLVQVHPGKLRRSQGRIAGDHSSAHDRAMRLARGNARERTAASIVNIRARWSNNTNQQIQSDCRRRARTSPTSSV